MHVLVISVVEERRFGRLDENYVKGVANAVALILGEDADLLKRRGEGL